MSTELIATIAVISVLAALLLRAHLEIKRLETPVQPLGDDTLARDGWIELPKAWGPSLGNITMSAHDAFWESDSSHRYVNFYGRSNAFDGFDLSSLTGKAPWEIPAIGVTAMQWDSLKSMMDAHKPFQNFIVGRADQHGRLRFGSMSGTPVFTTGGKVFAGYRAASRDVTAQCQAQMQMQIKDEVTRVLAASQRLSDAMAGLLEAVAKPLGWSYGARWMRDPRDDHFVCGEIWAQGNAQALVEVSKKERIPVAGDDLLARAWNTKQLVWITDVRTDGPGASQPDLKTAASQLRRAAAGAAGLHAAFALPVLVQGDCVCILEFFGPRIQRRDDFIDSVGDSVNNQISLFWLRREAEARLTYAATHDALTGLRNRLSFNAEFDKAIARAERNGWRTALLFIDLDGFKQINDTLGHHAGDIVLIDTARRFKSLVRASDGIARFGGDEFVVLLEQAGNDGDIADVANKLVRALRAPFPGLDASAQVSASIGIAIYPVDAQDPVALLNCADAAMYKTKASAESRIAFYRPPPVEKAAVNRAFAAAAESGTVSNETLPNL